MVYLLLTFECTGICLIFNINSFRDLIFSMSNYALITGASQGLGMEFAATLAQRGYNLLLVSRSEVKLQEVKEDLLKRHTITIHILNLDLSLPTAAEDMAAFCRMKALSIQVLINNAGFGLWGSFEELSLTEQQKMIQLNITTLTSVTHLMLPFLQSHTRSYILQVASTAAYQAVPTLAVYAATKAYVLSFARALREELKSKGVTVSCVCPGPMDTGFVKRAGMEAIKHLSDKYSMSASAVALIAVEQLFAGHVEVVPGWMNKAQRIGNWLFPKIMTEKIAARIYKKNR